MVKPKYLYHGSIVKIKGKKLLPYKPKDLGKNPENIYCAVYATNIKNIAIAMAIISCKGVNYSSLSFNRKPFGIIYKGWPKQKNIYLYTLKSKTFRRTGKSKKQYASLKPVEPFKIEKFLVKNYIDLVRKANEQEKKEFFKRIRKWKILKNGA